MQTWDKDVCGPVPQLVLLHPLLSFVIDRSLLRSAHLPDRKQGQALDFLFHLIRSPTICHIYFLELRIVNFKACPETPQTSSGPHAEKPIKSVIRGTLSTDADRVFLGFPTSFRAASQLFRTLIGDEGGYCGYAC